MIYYDLCIEKAQGTELVTSLPRYAPYRFFMPLGGKALHRLGRFWNCQWVCQGGYGHHSAPHFQQFCGVFSAPLAVVSSGIYSLAFCCGFAAWRRSQLCQCNSQFSPPWRDMISMWCITSKRKGGHQAMVEGFCMISMLQAMSTSYTMLHYVVTLCYTQWSDCFEYLWESLSCEVLLLALCAGARHPQVQRCNGLWCCWPCSAWQARCDAMVGWAQPRCSCGSISLKSLMRFRDLNAKVDLRF